VNHSRTLTKREAALVLGRVGILQDLDAGVIAGMAEQLRFSDVRRGESIYRQNDAADGLHVIITGKVKICCRAHDGHEKLLEIRGPAEIFGAVSVLDRGPRTATATALTDVCIGTADGDTLHRWLAERPDIAVRLMRLLAARLRRANNHLVDAAYDDVPGRLAKELLNLAQRFGTQEGDRWHVRHDLTQTELAQLVGATRESVNKALCHFVHRGWITTNGKATLIHHPQRLAHRSG
jgi:CRP/FNR family transcriptional regulator, cyclic AMP receptor protein